MVIAKTHDGDIGVMQSHPPVIGLLAEGSVVRILDAESTGSGEAAGNGPAPGGQGTSSGEVVAAVSGGFLSVADNRVSILARQAQLGSEVDTSAARAQLEATGGTAAGGEEPAETRYARARLRAAGEQA
jgi:F-type H+-transporting ATPase subunit epsilon